MARSHPGQLSLFDDFAHPGLLVGNVAPIEPAPVEADQLLLALLASGKSAGVILGLAESLAARHGLADHLLVALPDAPLVAVALDSGFSSPACFSRAYRQHYGQAPVKVRAILGRNEEAVFLFNLILGDRALATTVRKRTEQIPGRG